MAVDEALLPARETSWISRTTGLGSASRLRRTLDPACSSCTERDGALRREMLCRCPVALSLRLLDRVERTGSDPSLASPSDLASFAYQERALARRLPAIDRDVVADSALLARELQVLHERCSVEGCLACRAGGIVLALDQRLSGS